MFSLNNVYHSDDNSDLDPFWVRSRYGLPLQAGSELVEDFSALIKGTRIVWAGPWNQRPPIGGSNFKISKPGPDSIAGSSSEWEAIFPDSDGVLHLGDSILFPGLINAHAHLEYTHLAGLHPATDCFTRWIQWIVRAKQSWTEEDYAASWSAGAEQSLKHGCLWIADHQSHWRESLTEEPTIRSNGQLLPKIIAFPEYIHFTTAESGLTAFADRLKDWLSHWRTQAKRKWTGTDTLVLQNLGMSPHAPYTTLADGLKRLGLLAAEEQIQPSIHASESREELEMFLNGSGTLAEMMDRLGRPAESHLRTPIAFLNETGILRSNTLLAHANHLNEEDFQILKQNQCSIIHTPRCHQYFQRDRFPIEKFKAAGIPVSIGTDSLASTEVVRNKKVELDLKAEAREFLRNNPSESCLKTLHRLTTAPAKALGIEGVAGSIEAGTVADLAWIPAEALEKNPHAEAAAACLLNFQHPVSGIVLSGQPFMRREGSDVKDKFIN